MAMDHVLPMIAVGVFAARLGGCALWACRSHPSVRGHRWPTRFRGVPIPHVDRVIALSLVTFGLAVAMPARPSSADLRFFMSMPKQLKRVAVSAAAYGLDRAVVDPVSCAYIAVADDLRMRKVPLAQALAAST
jgi:hydrogenase/urease accessory protein HupE